MKYALTEQKTVGSITLRRVQALRDIPEFGIKAGDFGGWIEKQGNLSQEGAAWVSGDAQVSGNAWVYGDAQVSGNAWVSGDCSKSPILIQGLHWDVTIEDNHMRIGCQYHSLAAWEAFTPEEIAAMDSHAAEFWAGHKEILLGLARAGGRV